MILIIEDNPGIVRVVTRMLVQTFKVEPKYISVAASVSDALAFLRSFRYDLIVSDHDIIGGTGADVLNFLHAEQPHMVDHFVYFSGHDELRSVHAKFIEKGVHPAEFRRQIRAHAPHMPLAVDA